MDGVLDFSRPLDVQLLDRVVEAMYNGTPEQTEEANRVLTLFSESPDAWSCVDVILECSQNDNTKFIGLSILNNVVTSRWKVLPQDQRDGVKAYVLNMIIRLSSDPASLKAQQVYVNKLNLSLVKIVEQEWPHNWPTFVADVVEASKTNESHCENYLAVFRLLSEEVFDFSEERMLSSRAIALKSAFINESTQIYSLFEFVLQNGSNESLFVSALQTMQRFIPWFPLSHILEGNFMESLLYTFLPNVATTNYALQCLTEIGGLYNASYYARQMTHLLEGFLSQLPHVLPVDADFAEIHESNNAVAQECLQNTSIFLTTFLKSNQSTLADTPELSRNAHLLIARLFLIRSESIFKICLDHWHLTAQALLGNGGPFRGETDPRRVFLGDVLYNVKEIMFERMARPDEVLLVEDDVSGEFMRERTKDTAAMALYAHMQETLVLLTSLDPDETEAIMARRVAVLTESENFTFHELSTLCWAIGSVAGAMVPDQENRYMARILKLLLDFGTQRRGKENRSVIASNVMYVVGQYPRFLKSHWKFLRTVIKKLFEFMHESYPGVKEMATETFVKICRDCHRKFVTPQEQQPRPFVFDILENIGNITADLEYAETQTFYEAMGHMIHGEPVADQREMILASLFEAPNQTWRQIMAGAAENVMILQQTEVIQVLTHIFKTNRRACLTSGPSFMSQMERIYIEMLDVYRAYSGMISELIKTHGDQAMHRYEVKYMRAAKREILRLVETFVQKSVDAEAVVQRFIPPLFNAVLEDYQTTIPANRDAGVLSMLNAIIDHLSDTMTSEVPRMLDAVFAVTLEMIMDTQDNLVDLRTKLFTLLRTINASCFDAFFLIPGEMFHYVVESILYATKHVKPELAEIGINSLLEMFLRMEGTEIGQTFYQTFFMKILHEGLAVLTDTLHKASFHLHATLIQTMLNLVESGRVKAPLDPAGNYPAANNAQYVREWMLDSLSTAFDNLLKTEIKGAIQAMFLYHNDLPEFKQVMRDFLISLKTFSSQDNSDLFLEEKMMDDFRRKQYVKSLILHDQLAANPNPDNDVEETASFDPIYQEFDPQQYENPWVDQLMM